MKALYLSEWQAYIRFHDIPGGDRPLVFVHGLGCSSSSDYPSVAGNHRLTKRRRILVDLLGSGFSDRPDKFSYAIQAHADTVLSVMDALNISNADVFGHSMGGAVAITLASRRPERVSNLVLSEPNLDPGGGVFSRQIAEQSEATYAQTGHSAMIRVARIGGNTIWAGTMSASSAIAVHRTARSLVQGTEPSWRQQLLSLSMPRTVLFGEQSPPDPDAEALPGAGIRVVFVANAGHSMAWENPSGLANAITDAIS